MKCKKCGQKVQSPKRDMVLSGKLDGDLATYVKAFEACGVTEYVFSPLPDGYIGAFCSGPEGIGRRARMEYHRLPFVPRSEFGKEYCLECGNAMHNCIEDGKFNSTFSDVTCAVCKEPVNPVPGYRLLTNFSWDATKAIEFASEVCKKDVIVGPPTNEHMVAAWVPTKRFENLSKWWAIVNAVYECE